MATVQQETDTVLQHVEEVVTADGLMDLLEQGDGRVYAGYETSGPVHPGHWLSIRKLQDFEAAGFDPVVLWADRHTILNRKGDQDWSYDTTRAWVDDMTAYTEAVFDALDTDATYVRGNEFQFGREYGEDFDQITQHVSVERAQRGTGDVADGDTTYVSHLNYPLMQALDIAHLDADIALGGMDQRKIHMLAREELPELGYDKPVAVHYPILTSLQDGEAKMSSSRPDSTFALHDTADTIEDRIESAYCPVDQIQALNLPDTYTLDEAPATDASYLEAAFEQEPAVKDAFENNPVLQLAEYFVIGPGETLEFQQDERFGGEAYTYDDTYAVMQDLYTGDLHPDDLKAGVADAVADRLQPVRDRMADEPALLEPLDAAGYDTPDY